MLAWKPKRGACISRASCITFDPAGSITQRALLVSARAHGERATLTREQIAKTGFDEADRRRNRKSPCWIEIKTERGSGVPIRDRIEEN